MPTSWSTAGPAHVGPDTQFAGDNLTLSLKRVDRAGFLLVNRGFRWIQQQPNALIE
jgi:hypothetical protein